MAILILGLVVFIGVHAFTMMREPRAAAIARFGETGYKALYSIGALIGIALIWIGFGEYRASGMIPIWYPPIWTQHLAALLVLFAFILLPAAYLPGHIKARAKHPMFAVVKIWAFAHLLANGDLGSILLFGTFLTWAVLGRISAKRRAGDSVVIAEPQAKYDAIAVGIGVVAWLAFAFWLHMVLIGVPVFARA
ncbi:MAG: NnrU family protein [Salinarimonadaceae bacterium]|nr:MAG: NnrU family protein [Salinarimonadaceae bacterium]